MQGTPRRLFLTAMMLLTIACNDTPSDDAPLQREELHTIKQPLGLPLGVGCAEDADCLSGVCDTADSNTCELPGVCGNGKVDLLEACDDGNLLGSDGCSILCLVEQGGACTTDDDCAVGVCDASDSNTCEPANTCGNGKVEGLEACDDGNITGGDGCSALCLLDLGASCALDSDCALGVCDTAGSNTCELPNICGNGKLDLGEACDDGDIFDGDGCTGSCLLEPGVTCSSDEQCFTGVCDTADSNTCELANTCGNGKVEGIEACDDGNLLGNDGCSALCLIEIGEPCSSNADCATDTCDSLDSNTCELPNTCGNGTVEGIEVCDDGNLSNNDGCSTLCLLEENSSCTNDTQCVTGICDTIADNRCELPNICGNGKVEGVETCDDGNLLGNDGCSTLCLLDLGAACVTDADCATGVCDTKDSNTCELPNTCGNGKVELGEACDDGNIADGDGCSLLCLIEENGACTQNDQCITGLCDTLGEGRCELLNTCGNGKTEGIEACDDGNTSNGDGCSASCLIDLGGSCNSNADCVTGVCDTRDSNTCELLNICGNGTVEGIEACDDGNLLGNDGCSALCLLEVGSNCVADGECVSGVCDVLESHTCELLNTCGNGKVEGIEACDDGNLVGGDGCTALCLLELGGGCSDDAQCISGTCDLLDSNLCEPTNICGNGKVEGIEACDDGNLLPGDGCDPLCLTEIGGACGQDDDCASSVCDTKSSGLCELALICGNGKRELLETCDDGNLADGDGCSALCLFEQGVGCSSDADCASGVCDTAESNVCEPTNICGNGKLEGGETCDDGNTDSGDGCASNCLLEDGQPCADASRCFSGICDAGVCEPAGQCGNGVIEQGESCDDSNVDDGDGCSASCLREEGTSCTSDVECTTGVCDLTGSNRCEPGDTCGNGRIDGSEVCDDGNITNGDGCSASCKREDGGTCGSDTECASGVCDNASSNRCEPSDVCGNGKLEGAEACDDGNIGDGDGCSASCKREDGSPCAGDGECASGVCDTVGSGKCEQPNTCGNGHLEHTEACDDGGTTDGDGCSADCKREDGGGCSTDAECVSGLCDGGTCKPAGQCGNNVIEQGEACDDGDQDNDNACDNACKRNLNQPCSSDTQCASGTCDLISAFACEPADVCGNGKVESAEACDDGNTTGGDGCSSGCLFENNAPCAQDSECDSGTCDTVGSNRCEPAHTCGNGKVEGVEACDDGNTIAGDGCAASCREEDGGICGADSECESGRCVEGECRAMNTCGDGHREGQEGCDDGNLIDGDGCSASCLIEEGWPCLSNASCASTLCDVTGSSQCEPIDVCGNGHIEEEEACDDGNEEDGDGCSSSCLREVGEECEEDADCESAWCDEGFCARDNVCGNGRQEASETCDDGNTADGDGCSSTCFTEETGMCEADEECEHGETCDVTGSRRCEPTEACGNGSIEEGEACDDGALTQGDGCSSSCLLELGEPCGESSGCESGYCDAGGVCACDEDADCAPGEICVADGVTGSCVMPSEDDREFEPESRGNAGIQERTPLSVTSPVDGDILDVPSLRLTGRGDAGGRVEVIWEDARMCVTQVEVGGGWSCDVTLDGPGEHVLRVVHGEQEAEITIEVLGDGASLALAGGACAVSQGGSAPGKHEPAPLWLMSLALLLGARRTRTRTR